MESRIRRTEDSPVRNEEYYYSLIRPEVEQTFSHEQREELRSVLKRIALVPSKKLVDFRTTFWFFKPMYLVIFLGIDRRYRDLRYDRWHMLAVWVSRFAIILLMLAVLGILFFSVAYMIKSALGIDFFPDRHLRDFILGDK